MKWLVTVSFLVFALCAAAQNNKPSQTDSLERKLAILKPGADKIKVQQKLFFLYLKKDAKKALALAISALNEAKQLKKDTTICVFYDDIGEAYYYLEDFNTSLQYLNKCYQLAKKINYKRQVALSLCDMSGDYQAQSNDIKSLNCSLQALNIYEEFNDYRQIALIYFNIGVTYNNQNNYQKSIYYAQKALQVLKKIPDSDVVSNVYVLLGSSCAGENKIPEARGYYNKALQKFRHINDNYNEAVVLSLLSSLYSGEYQKQLGLALQARQLWDKVAPDNFTSISNLGDLGTIYGKMAMQEKEAGKREKLLKNAQQYLLRAISVGKKTNTKSVVIDYSDSLSIIDQAVGDYKGAYTNLLTHNKLYDSVYSQDNKNKIASLEGKHEIDLRDKQLLINKLEIANQHKQRWFLLGGLLTLFIISGLIYYQNMQRKKINTTLLHLNSELDEANKVKTRFFSILNHDLRSPVASFVNFLHLQQEAPDLMDETARSAYSKKATASAENLLNTMEDLLLWSKGQMENFKPTNRVIPVSDLFQYVKTFLNLPENIILSFEQEPGMELSIDEHYVKTIMYNLTNNAIKALGNAAGGSIVWKAWQEGGQKYMSVTDNGPGASEEAFRALYDESAPIGIKSGLGLHIIRDLAMAIKCKIAMINISSGVEIILVMPVN